MRKPVWQFFELLLKKVDWKTSAKPLKCSSRLKTILVLSKMAIKSVKLGSGDLLPTLGFGTWKSKPGEVSAAVEYALKVGYRHIDCAAVYGNESEVGAGLKAALRKGYCKREDVFVVSKLWNTFHQPKDVEGACLKSLRDLGLEYLDLYLIHWPTGFQPGPELFPKNSDGTMMVSYFSKILCKISVQYDQL